MPVRAPTMLDRATGARELSRASRSVAYTRIRRPDSDQPCGGAALQPVEFFCILISSAVLARREDLSAVSLRPNLRVTRLDVWRRQSDRPLADLYDQASRAYAAVGPSCHCAPQQGARPPPGTPTTPPPPPPHPRLTSLLDDFDDSPPRQRWPRHTRPSVRVCRQLSGASTRAVRISSARLRDEQGYRPSRSRVSEQAEGAKRIARRSKRQPIKHPDSLEDVRPVSSSSSNLARLRSAVPNPSVKRTRDRRQKIIASRPAHPWSRCNWARLIAVRSSHGTATPCRSADPGIGGKVIRPSWVRFM